MVSRGIKSFSKITLPLMLALLVVAMSISCAAPPTSPEEPTSPPPEQPPAPTIIVKGTAFNDYNGNGTKEEDEPIIAGLKLEFYDNYGKKSSTVETDNEGTYMVTLLKGRYTFHVYAENITGYNNHPCKYLNISKEEFRPIDSPVDIEANINMIYDIKLMQGFLTLPFPKGTIETHSRSYVDVDLTKGVMRDWKGNRQTYDNHLGTDFMIPIGIPILAAAPGIVVESKYDQDDGNRISIKHPDGNLTIYCHLETRTAQYGEEVSRGDKIGMSGNTGRLVGLNPHLHFQFSDFGTRRVDPYRDTTNSQSVSWWTVDNDPRYP